MVRKKHVWGLLAAAAVLPFGWRFIQVLFDHQALMELIYSAGNWRVVVFLGAHTVAAAVGIPGTVQVVLGDELFGLLWGTMRQALVDMYKLWNPSAQPNALKSL